MYSITLVGQVPPYRIIRTVSLIDIVNAQLKTRFKGMHDVASRFSVLFSANIINKDENIIIQEANPNIQTMFHQNFQFSLYLIAQQWKVKWKKLKEFSKLQIY